MDEKTFPYRLEARSRAVLAGLMKALIDGGAKLQSSQVPMTLLFENKSEGLPADAPVYMMRDGIRLSYKLNHVAKICPECMDWLKAYNQYISRRLKAHAVPAAERCLIQVEATYDGTLKYYFYYMMRYDDNSLAQDMPQGLHIATESLFAPAQPAQPAMPAVQAQPAQPAGQPEQASWM